MKPGTDDKALRQIFSEYGDITDIHHKGSYAFMEFARPDQATAAIKGMAEKSDMRV
jgi:hypothetical protein